MSEALTVLLREFELVTEQPLTDPSLDIFDLGLDSIVLLSLMSRLRNAGYTISFYDLVHAESMVAVAKAMQSAC
jgi:aryl carrier-like protein